MDVFLWTFSKFLECFFDVLQKFSKSSWKYWQNMFAKVSLCRWLFCKNNNTINCDDNNNQFPDTRAFAFTRQPMKWNFTWSIGTITSSICIAALPFYLNQSLDLQKKLKNSFCKRAFANYWNHAKTCCFQKMVQLFNLMWIMLLP